MLEVTPQSEPITAAAREAYAAWRRTLTLDPFDGDAGAAFIDAYRGRGPEHPVR